MIALRLGYAKEGTIRWDFQKSMRTHFRFVVVGAETGYAELRNNPQTLNPGGINGIDGTPTPPTTSSCGVGRCPVIRCLALCPPGQEDRSFADQN